MQEIYYGFEAVWVICKIVALVGGGCLIAFIGESFLNKKKGQ